jgi:hypothetical protein
MSYHVDLRGYYQHIHFYEGKKEQIKGWLTLPPPKEDHRGDIVCHLRLGDYDVTGGAPVIDKSWYLDLLNANENKGKKIYIVCQGVYSDGEREHPSLKTWERKYMTGLQEGLVGRDVTFVHGTLAEDFHFLRSFGILIISNSSMAWWAAWLSDVATKVYTFARWRHKSPLVKLACARGMTPTQGSYIWEKEKFEP